MKQLSFSQISRYGTCARSYRLYYKDRLRERTATAFLSFGSAMDAALNSILISVKDGKQLPDYKKIFEENWEKITINKRQYSLPLCTLVGYSKSDFVYELLQDKDLKEIKEVCDSFNLSYGLDISKSYDELESKKSRGEINEKELSIYNFMNWLSMKNKGVLMLDAYVRDILPQIEEVKDVQSKIELQSDSDTSLIGYIDAVVKFKGNDFYSILDNKTSAQPYSDDKVGTSQQLSLYAYALDLRNAAFGVMLKNIKLNRVKICSVCSFDGSGARHKTCSNEASGTRCNGAWTETVKPEATTQLVTGTIDEETQHVVIDNIAEINDAIEKEVYPKNLNACSNIYGNPCPYMSKCWKNKEDNLEYVE